MPISIIIPTYNRAHLISKAITSVINQTYAAWELIIVDDGSTDNTDAVINEFLSDKRIKYYKKNNSGAAESRNMGVEKATGDLISFLDSDDEADPTWLEKMTRAAEAEKAAVVCCGLTRYNNPGSAIGKGMPLNMGPLFKNVVARFTNGGVYLLKKNIFTAVGGFDPLLRSGQHTEFAIRVIPYLLESRQTIANVFESLIKVYIHDGPRIRHNYESIYLGSTYTLKKHYAAFAKDRENHFLYLSIAGVAAMRTKRYDQATLYFYKALKRKPFRPLSWIRLILSFVPKLRDSIWRK